MNNQPYDSSEPFKKKKKVSTFDFVWQHFAKKKANNNFPTQIYLCTIFFSIKQQQQKGLWAKMSTAAKVISAEPNPIWRKVLLGETLWTNHFPHRK